jgi:phosphatidylethanolamine/phosphatidyl-N-methylethanolamine N-methyltransferase
MTFTTVELYQRMAPLYDIIYGALLQPGRDLALARLAPRAGQRILEIGVGTGFALRRYPGGCTVVAIDLSAPMIARAQARLRRHRLAHVALCRMDGAALAFADQSFDAVYAPYVLNVVPDPVRVAREMLRVCRPGGRLVILNHFDHPDELDSSLGRMVGQIAATLTGVNWKFGFPDFMRDSGLEADSIEAANVAGVSSVVVCRRR